MQETKSKPVSLEKLFSLHNKIAIVTGASRGIGWHLADGLARAGAYVYALARSVKPKYDNHSNTQYMQCNVANEKEFKKIQEKIIQKHKTIDILINAAGITIPNSEVDGFDQTISINLRAPYMCINAIAPIMRQAQHGTIINITSLSAFLGFPNNPAYAASKGGLSQLTRALAYDLGKDGIRVNNIVPGYIATEMTKSSYSDKILYEQRKKHTILNRWGEPQDLIGAAIFLSSDASLYITGQDIIVDGGWLAKGLV